jgi:hypothetical protein
MKHEMVAGVEFIDVGYIVGEKKFPFSFGLEF